MGARRKGRELAVQALYQMELTGEDSRDLVDRIAESFGGSADARTFARELTSQIHTDREEIDRVLGAALEHWSFDRLSRVDRNVLRVGTCELMNDPDARLGVVIGEAIEIARRFGSDGADSFVNGVLDRVAGALGRHATPPAAAKA